MDPETGLDAIRNVGISGNKIAAISTGALRGKKVLDVTGMVVSPGFIDLHVHGVSNTEQEYQLHDGLTTALELEWGVGPLKAWYAQRKSNALINYGASVCWPYERFRALEKFREQAEQLKESSRLEPYTLINTIKQITPSYTEVPDDSEMRDVPFRFDGTFIAVPMKAYTNCAVVRLFVTGRSRRRIGKGRFTGPVDSCGDPESSFVDIREA